MKKLLPVVLALLLLVGCGAKEDTSDPYAAILIPPGVEFGMNSHEVGELIGYDAIPESGLDDMRQYPRKDLNHHCGVFSVRYLFSRDEHIEFEDTGKLRNIWVEVRDFVPFQNRTKDFHGDIEAEYETIKDYVTDIYGEPDYPEEDLGFPVGAREIGWDADQGFRVTLALKDLTTGVSEGRIEVWYSTTL